MISFMELLARRTQSLRPRRRVRTRVRAHPALGESTQQYQTLLCCARTRILVAARLQGTLSDEYQLKSTLKRLTNLPRNISMYAAFRLFPMFCCVERNTDAACAGW
jgi:hypothetical protein